MTLPLIWLDVVSAALLLPMAIVALYNRLTAPRLEAASTSPNRPSVSLLVPARNEASNLRRTLPRFLALEYPGLEILVLDDESEDDTAELVDWVVGGGGARLIRGEPLPDGWLGKNWACHQLAAQAAGDVLIFCDADVRVQAEAVQRTIDLLETECADAVTALPRQELRGWGERALVPLVTQLPVAALLPLSLISRTPDSSVSMANGQWLAIRREAYDAIDGHRSVRGEVLEDVSLGRRIKGSGFRLVVAVAPTLLSVRMYHGLRDAREGFRKNLYALVGARPLGLAAGYVVFLLTAVYPWLAPLGGRLTALVPLGLLLAVRASAALLFRHGGGSVALHPVGAVLLLLVAAESAVGHRRRTAQWKGRPVRVPVSSRATPARPVVESRGRG